MYDTIIRLTVRSLLTPLIRSIEAFFLQQYLTSGLSDKTLFGNAQRRKCEDTAPFYPSIIDEVGFKACGSVVQYQNDMESWRLDEENYH